MRHRRLRGAFTVFEASLVMDVVFGMRHDGTTNMLWSTTRRHRTYSTEDHHTKDGVPRRVKGLWERRPSWAEAGFSSARCVCPRTLKQGAWGPTMIDEERHQLSTSSRL
jgi:hypothetical protein